jgi:hypothetical protein
MQQKLKVMIKVEKKTAVEGYDKFCLEDQQRTGSGGLLLRKLLLTIIFVKIHEKHQHVCFISLNFWTLVDLSIFFMLGLLF